MKILNSILGLAFLILLFMCCSNENPTRSSSGNQFAIYFLQDSNLSYMDAMKQPIESIKISSSPIASQNTMDQYKIYKVGEIQSLMHAIVFNKNMKKIFGNQNRLFMIMADGEKIYIGEYWANFMNTVAPDIMMYPYKDNEFHILSNDEGANRINDNRIISCITESGIKLTYY